MKSSPYGAVAQQSRKLWYLKRIKLFEVLSASELSSLAERSLMREVRRGETLFFPGEPSDRIFLLKRGRVKIAEWSPEGQELELTFLTPGEIFGELALFQDEPWTTAAQAAEDSLLCVITKKDFEELIVRRQDLLLRVIKLVGLRFRRLETHVGELLFYDVPGRLSRLLLQLADEWGVRDARGIRIPFKLTHEELAHLIGATRPTVTRTLLALQAQGVVEMAGKRITVRDRWHLEKMSQEGKRPSGT